MYGEVMAHREEQDPMSEMLKDVSVLQTEITSLKGQISATATKAELSALSTQVGDIYRLVQQINNDRRTPWGNIFAGISVGVTIIALIGGLVGYGLNNKIDYTAQSANLNTDRINQARAELGTLNSVVLSSEARVAEKMGEIETQFRAGGQIQNLKDHQHDVLIDQLWQKQFGQPLKSDTPWPVLGKER